MQRYYCLIFQIDQGMLGLGRGSRDYYLNDTVFAHQLNAYHKYLFDVVRILITDANETRTQKQLNQDLIEIIEFEKKLAEVRDLFQAHE
jgi:hypothetical protein